jgi:hypothetical protein
MPLNLDSCNKSVNKLRSVVVGTANPDMISPFALESRMLMDAIFVLLLVHHFFESIPSHSTRQWTTTI